MPTIFINRDALFQNILCVKKYQKEWGIDILPVLKAVSSYAPISTEIVRMGFNSLAFAEIDEYLNMADKVRCNPIFINIPPLSRVHDIVNYFSRSSISSAEAILALSLAAQELNKVHNIIIMVELGDGREGANIKQLPALLALATQAPGLNLVGFGITLACLGTNQPNNQAIATLTQLKDLFISHGVANPVVSVGGSVFCSWIDKNGAGPITELRTGDPFLLGYDIYNDAPLPRANFRQDVFTLSAEILEIYDKQNFNNSEPTNLHHYCTNDWQAEFVPNGLRRRALLDLGHFHVAVQELKCCLNNAKMVGCSSAYLALDITDIIGNTTALKVGSQVKFKLGYWSLARAFRNGSVTYALINDKLATL